MKGFLSKTMIFLGIFSLVMGTLGVFGINTIYAEDLELIGNDLGLVVEPSSTRLFNLTNLNPGDTEVATVNIKNQYSLPFDLSMRAERTSPMPEEGDVDLFKQLIITVYLDGVEIYSGPMIDFAISNIALGNFDPGAEIELSAEVHLPGPETGNEFQGKNVDVKWIFIAESEEEPETPGPDPVTPDPDPGTPFEPPVIPFTPATPVVPEEEVIDEDIPEDIPEVEEPDEEIDEEIPEDLPEVEEPEEEVVDEELAEDRPIMPRTGEISPILYYGLGSVFLLLGFGTRKKKK